MTMRSTANSESEILTAPRPEERGFFAGIFKGLAALAGGMKITLSYFLTPSTIITQQYPENRATLKMFERARLQLTMDHDENGWHRCNACRTCENACPNGSILVTEQRNSETNKKEIKFYTWRMDTCTFCNACVMVCPTEALAMLDQFESSVYDRRLLIFNLNHYAGPPAKEMVKIENPEDRARQTTPIYPYDGPVALMGRQIDGLKNDDLQELARQREKPQT
jgi:NADH-quinone oxidoreductase subunit I